MNIEPEIASILHYKALFCEIFRSFPFDSDIIGLQKHLIPSSTV